MSNLTKERKKLEKCGFSGRTLEKALELIERSGSSSIVTKMLIAYVVRQEKTPAMALYETENVIREAENRLRKKGIFPP